MACLKTGRSAARDTEDVRPVPLSFVKLTQIHLPPVVQDIVELLVLTGMRVGEAVIMRAIDLDMTGKVWLYKPRYHKNLWRGHTRKIAIGPRGQLILRKYLTPKVDAYVFSPRQQQVLINAEKRAGRKTKVQPSQLCRKKAHPRKKLGERFLSGDINAAIQRACGRAKVSPWHTHQLRHTAALEVSRQHGLEAARAMLGQKTVQVSAHYAGIDEKLAKHVARKIG
ncbi:MAG: site-specific integrase [Planctomycetes bacterium]|nr:site-specific integrase [Planctomycetota bacterium]